LVNSAGFTKPVAANDLEGLTDDLFDEVVQTNLRGVFATIRAFTPLLKATGDGLIVNVSSIAGFTGAGSNLAYAAAKAGVDQIIYLGGLASGGSEHLESRHATAGYLGSAGVPVTYLQAAAVIGAGSESYRTLYWLVKRLPVMVTPRWTSTRTQPIAVRDVIAYLVAAPETPGAKGQVIQIGGPDVTTYGGMFSELASAMGKRPPLQVKIPLLTPKLSSHWIGLVTPVDAGVAKPLIEGLTVETVVDDPSGMALFDISPTPITEAMKLALIEQGVAPAHS
jgi:NAD(P)-dependent dehydrogenase (short-subunit alcohol dehydrogenase family)